MTSVTDDRFLLWGQALGCAYVALLGLGITLPCRLAACDLLFPAMLCLLAIKAWSNAGDVKAFFRRSLRRCEDFENLFLLLFIACSHLCTIQHILTHGAFLANIFEWSVFFYCALLFFFYRMFPLSKAQMLRLGTCILTAFFLCWLYDMAVYAINADASPVFWEVYGKMEKSSMPFLARRYTFTFGNPNLAAPYCALGALLVALGLDDAKRKIPHLLLLVANLLPVACTMSKHGVLYLGVLLCLLAKAMSRFIGEKWAKCLALAALALVICVFEMTVLFVTFPIKGDFPYINTQPGMYSIHQKAYFRMLTEPGHSIGITGASVEKLRELYPLCVDAQSAEQTLKFYNSEKDLGSFCAYMDPHCEYLNLATLFGVLEMLFAVLCLVFMSRRSSFGMFWCCAILGCMLWDDVLSKRWIWIGNAIIVIIEKHRECKNETLQQRAPVGGN